MQTPIRQKRPNLRIPHFRPCNCRPLHRAARAHAPLPSPLLPAATDVLDSSFMILKQRTHRDDCSFVNSETKMEFPAKAPNTACRDAKNFHWGCSPKVPQKINQIFRHCLHILTAETIKIRNFCTIHFLVLDQYVSR